MEQTSEIGQVVGAELPVDPTQMRFNQSHGVLRHLQGRSRKLLSDSDIKPAGLAGDDATPCLLPCG